MLLPDCSSANMMICAAIILPMFPSILIFFVSLSKVPKVPDGVLGKNNNLPALPQVSAAQVKELRGRSGANFCPDGFPMLPCVF